MSMSDSDFIAYDEDPPEDVKPPEEVVDEEKEEVAVEELDLAAEEAEDKSDEMATILARKWRGHMSELEVDDEQVTQTRPLITVTVHRLRKFFGDECHFHDSDPDNKHSFASFPSQSASLRKFIHRVEIDRGTQLKGPTVESTTQTYMSFKRNKMVQTATQFISDENIEIIMKSRNMAQFFKIAMPKLEKVMQQNEMVDLLFNDYKSGMKARFGQPGHEMEFNPETKVVPHPDDKPPPPSTTPEGEGGDKDKDGTETKEDKDKEGTETKDKDKEAEKTAKSKPISKTMEWMRLHKEAQQTIIKRDGMDLAEEIEQEERLNNEYLLFLKFQAEIVEILAQTEPELPTENKDIEDEFEELVRAAQQRQADEDAEDEALLDEEEAEEDEKARDALLESLIDEYEAGSMDEVDVPEAEAAVATEAVPEVTPAVTTEVAGTKEAVTPEVAETKEAGTKEAVATEGAGTTEKPEEESVDKK